MRLDVMACHMAIIYIVVGKERWGETKRAKSELDNALRSVTRRVRL